ncbi:MAG: ATP-binding protein [Aquificae bacterium]|nr:ATP-binding protein [Aquificota bacterium]
MKKLYIRNFGFIKESEIEIGDLTVFVGPQASGKTLVLELIKLLVDKNIIIEKLKKHGFQWKSTQEFLEQFFGGGLGSVWKETTLIKKDGREVRYNTLHLKKKSKYTSERVFYIPAQRVLIYENEWPKSFSSYYYYVPYVVRNFSEEIRLLSDKIRSESIFPIKGKLPEYLKNILDKTIFRGTKLKKSSGMKKRFILEADEKELPIMVWSAGQREFIPLLLGLYKLMPAGKKSKEDSIDMVIIEEPEMGLHPVALQGVLVFILELLKRGYRVIMSTHSTLPLDFIWMINQLVNSRQEGLYEKLKSTFNFKNINDVKTLWDAIINKKFKVYFFKPEDEGVYIKDISKLALDSDEEWGNLTLFVSQVTDIVAEFAE